MYLTTAQAAKITELTHSLAAIHRTEEGPITFRVEPQLRGTAVFFKATNHTIERPVSAKVRHYFAVISSSGKLAHRADTNMARRPC